MGGGGGVRTKFSVQLWSQAEQNPYKVTSILICNQRFVPLCDLMKKMPCPMEIKIPTTFPNLYLKALPKEYHLYLIEINTL